jgi:hypothetical protein
MGQPPLKDGKLQVYTKPDDNGGISTILEDHEGTIWITRYNAPRGEGPLCRVELRDGWQPFGDVSHG